MYLSRRAAILAAVFLLSACGGGGAIPSPGRATQPIGTPSAPTADVSVNGTISQSGPQLLAHKLSVSKMRRTAAALSFSKIIVDGTLYTGDAAAYTITNEITTAVPANGVYTASVPFSNVPVHNNEWVVLQFFGEAADGSKISIGDLAGLVNVGSGSANSATLTASSTQTFQIFLDLLRGGFISSWDLDNEPALASTLATAITNAGGTVNSTTQLFDRSERLRLYNAIFPKYQRNLTVSTSVAGEITVVADYTNSSEIDLAANGQATSINTEPGYMLTNVPTAAGGLMEIQQAGTPSSTYTPVISGLLYTAFSTNGGSQTLYGVYGGHLLLGATTASAPFQSGLIHVAGRAMGSSSATIPTAPSTVNIAVSDPQGFAFSGDRGFQVEYHVHANEALSNAFMNSMSSPNYANVSLPANYSATYNRVSVNTFTPFGLSQKDLEMCTPDDATCIPLTATSGGVLRGFYDDGTDLGFFNYAAGGAASGIAQASNEYNVTTSGAGTATLTTTVPTAITPGQSIEMQYYANGTSLPWTLTAYDASGKAYPASVGYSSGYSVGFVFNSVLFPIKATKMVFTFSSPGATTLTWEPNYN